MEVIVEMELDVIETNDWGWSVMTIALEFRGYFRHRGHRFLSGVSPAW